MTPAIHRPTLKLISEAEAREDIRELYEKIKEFFNIDFVPQQFQAMAHDPGRLREAVETGRKWYSGELGLDARTAELVALGVAISRGCNYCANWHITMLKAMGMSDDELESVVYFIGTATLHAAYTAGTQLEPDVTPDLAGRIAQSKAVKRAKETPVKPSI